MNVRNAAGGHDLVPKGIENAEIVQQQQSRDHKDRACDVEENMDDARALGIRLGADGAHDGGRHAVSDVDADNDGIDRRKRQRTGHGDRLQNTDRCTRALQQKSDPRTEQETQDRRIGKTHKHPRKGLRLRQRRDRARHAEKSRKENAEAHGNTADRFGFTALHHHQKDDADHRRQRRKRDGLEKIEPRACRGVHIEQSDDLTGHRGADVCAENDADRLAQRQNARADQTGGQHDGRGRALDHRRDRKSEKETDKGVVRHFLHGALERVGRTFLQPVSHHLHTIEEQSQSSEEGYHVEYRHILKTPVLCQKKCCYVIGHKTVIFLGNPEFSPNTILSFYTTNCKIFFICLFMKELLHLSVRVIQYLQIILRRNFPC